MASNRKYKNGMWKDESKHQEKISMDLFTRFTNLFTEKFKYMGTRFNQESGECSYTYTFESHEYFMLVSREGTIMQESISSK